MSGAFKDEETQIHYVEKGRESNAKKLDWIEKMTGSQVEMNVPRMDMFMDFLVETGLMTRQQLLNFLTKWEDHLALQLKDMMEKVQLAQRNAREAQRENERGARLITPGNKPGLLGPNGQKL